MLRRPAPGTLPEPVTGRRASAISSGDCHVRRAWAKRRSTMSELCDAVLVGYVRTPFGRADAKRGVFREVRSDDLAVLVLHELLRRTGVAAADVQGIILGAVEMM